MNKLLVVLLFLLSTTTAHAVKNDMTDLASVVTSEGLTGSIETVVANCDAGNCAKFVGSNGSISGNATDARVTITVTGLSFNAGDLIGVSMSVKTLKGSPLIFVLLNETHDDSFHFYGGNKTKKTIFGQLKAKTAGTEVKIILAMEDAIKTTTWIDSLEVKVLAKNITVDTTHPWINAFATAADVPFGLSSFLSSAYWSQKSVYLTNAYPLIDSWSSEFGSDDLSLKLSSGKELLFKLPVQKVTAGTAEVITSMETLDGTNLVYIDRPVSNRSTVICSTFVAPGITGATIDVRLKVFTGNIGPSYIKLGSPTLKEVVRDIASDNILDNSFFNKDNNCPLFWGVESGVTPPNITVENRLAANCPTTSAACNVLKVVLPADHAVGVDWSAVVQNLTTFATGIYKLEAWVKSSNTGNLVLAAFNGSAGSFWSQNNIDAVNTWTKITTTETFTNVNKISVVLMNMPASTELEITGIKSISQ